jgi:exopolysaccharide biosynthesis polyprenyl glycosylphosphotransferase
MSQRRTATLSLLKLCDLTVVAMTFILAIATTQRGLHPGEWRDVLELRVTVQNALFIAAYVGAWHFVLKGWGLYRSFRLAPAARELRRLAIAVTMAALPLWPAGQLLDFEYVNASFLVAFMCMTFASLAVERRVIRAFARMLRRRGMNLRSAVIVGDVAGVAETSASLMQRSDLGYSVVESIELANGRADGLSPIEQIDDAKTRIDALIDRAGLDEVFIVLPLDGSDPSIRELISHCEEQGIMVRVLTRIADLNWARVIVDEVAGQPVLSITSGPPDSFGLLLKRAIDVTIAVVGLLACLPIFIAVAIAIKLDSRGPVFFCQERVGLNRRRFTTYKFRTMVPDALVQQESIEHLNEADGPVFKIKNDPRITRVGEFLRRTSIDELPQLFNVLKDEMSLVGPRPLPVRDVNRMDIRWHKRRFAVKPGITCLWQARSREPRFDEWIQADMEYIDQWSLALDLKILLRTIPAVLHRNGAY